MDELKILVSAAQQGDKAAFNQVVLRFQDMAYATAYAIVRDVVLAQDAAQEAFIDAYLSLANLREPAAFPGWFRRIVVRHADRQTRGRVETAAVGNRALLDLLLTHGADINSQPKPGQPTPLHEAVHLVQPAVIDFLLARGANPNPTAYRNQTPLHLAVHRNTAAIAQKLLTAGAEINHKDAFGRTPLDWAQLYGRTAIIDRLTAHDPSSSLPVQVSTVLPTRPAELRRVPVGPQVLGRLLDSAGHPLDDVGLLDEALTLPIYRPATATQPPMLATGIKIIDLFAPLKRGGHNALLSPMSGLGRMVLLSQLAYSMHTLHDGYTVCLGLDRRGYTAQDMLLYWRQNGAEPRLMSERVVNVFAHSHDKTEQKLHAAETSLTIAEAFRAEGREVLLLVDAELTMSEGVAAYLKANTAATPTAAITTLYWGDYTIGYEPAPLAGLDAALALERWRAEQALYPAIDPLRSRSVLVETGIIGNEHCRLVAELKRRFVRYAELDRILEKLGEDALATLDDPHALQDVRRIRRVHRFLTQPLPGLEFFTGLLGVQVSLADTIAGCRAILAGEVDALPEEAFYMAGTLEQVRAKAQTR